MVEELFVFPASFAQQRLWFLNQMTPNSAAYNVPEAVRLKGALNVKILQQALEAIITRHESLRTTFELMDENPVQVISEKGSIVMPVIDLSELLETDIETEIQKLIAQEVQQPFNLTQGPLLRTTLLHLTEKEHVLLVTMHHIISDGWSMGIFIQELSALYEAFSSGKPSPLPDLSLQYADFTEWQREWLQGSVLETQLSYWKQHLAHLPVLQLPSDRKRPAIQTFRGATQSFALPPDLSAALKALSRQEGVTLFMTLLAAFQTLLHRYTRQDDIVVGSPIANRNRVEMEGLIGFFVNTLVLRTDLSGNPSFREMLARVRQVTLGAYAHQDLPLEQLVKELQPERNLSYTPLFQVMFAFQNAPTEELKLPGMTSSPIEVSTHTAKFDLTLDMCETQTELTGVLEYSTDLFDACTIRRMLGHFQTMLTGIVANPDSHISKLPLLTATEQHQLLVEWNNQKVEYPDKCIHQLFEEQVELSPDAVALIFEDEQLTYGELNRRANKIAHYLQQLGVGPEVLVGMCVERSLSMVVGILGILKAGGAYLPLDPTDPPERLAVRMSDAQVSVVLTQQKFALELSPMAKHVICLDTDWVAINLESQQNPVAGTKIDNLAYVMYTSGSTGRPKGVSVIHRGVVRLVKQTNYASFSSQQVFLQLAPTAFDASTFEIWGSLLNGARLVLFPGKTPSMQKLGIVIQQHQITTLWLTAGLFHLMVDEQLEALQPLRQLLAGGDVLSVPHVRKLFQKLKNCTLINGYGPTENTTFTCCFPMTASCQIGDSVPIGRPIANTQTYILDRHLQPVPIGVPGELYVGGAGLAREYLNRPELTAERFIANPFVDGERLYKTGDLVRYLADGNIEFLGRIDLQVKIRGFRIEPGEIEAVVSQHPHVQQVVVIVRSDRPGDKYLAAYVVPAETQMLSVEELRLFVRQHLPEYMIPAAFVMLNAFPLNANGKVDRRALPKPNLELSREINFVAPRTPTEVVIASIMATVLGLERFGIYDNFFALGGHSLLATQVISRLRSAFPVELPLRCLFESPTVASLDKFISEEQTDSAQLLPAIAPVSKDTTEFPLSFAQERLWFLNQLEGESATYNMPFVVRIAGNLNFNALESAIGEIVQRHAILRTNFQVVNGSTVQVIKPTATIPLFVVLHEPTGEEQLWQLATLEAQTPFDLAIDSLVRVKLLQLSEQEHFLLLTMHHIVSDGWSMGIFIQELSALYQAFCEGNPSPLPELPIQYVDYAVWQRQWLTSEVLERQLNYWQQHLAGAPPLLELPYDRPRKAVQTFRGGSVPFEIDAQLTQQLKILSQESGVTLFMTGLAAFVTLLFRYSGQSDILVGSPIANRHYRETDSLIGFFVNTIVLRTQILDNPSFKQLLHQVRLVALGAYTHQDVPFEQVVEALQPERSLSHSPLFQVMFDLLQESEHWELPGLSLTPVETENGTAKFDL